MSWELHTLRGNLGLHRPDWDDLNARLCASNPYFSSSFIDPLLEHFGKGNECICIHRTAHGVDAMVIVVPVSIGKWATFLPAQAQIAPVMVCDVTDLRQLLPRLSHSTIALDLLSQDPQISRLKSGEAQLPVVSSRHARTVSISLAASFDMYWAQRPKKLRQNIDRRMRRAHESHREIRYDEVSDPGQIEAAVRRYGELESSGWKGQVGTSIHADNDQGRFYVDTMTRFAVQGRAFAYELFFDGRLVASRLAVSSDRMLVMLKTTYDEAESRLAPGRLLLYLVLEAEFRKQRYEAVEFYTDANKDLIEWSTSERWISHHLLLRNFLLKRLYHLFRGKAETQDPSAAVV